MFIDILKNELSSAEKIHTFKQTDSLEVNSKKKDKAIKTFSFGYRKGPQPPKPILVAMNLEFDILGGNTTVDDLMEVLMFKDLSKNKKIIHLAAKYNIIEGLIKRLLPWCPNLKPAVMERSGIFICLNEGPLKASSLYKATPLTKEIEDRMDAIFKAKYR